LKSPTINRRFLFVGLDEKPAEGVSAKVLRSESRVHARVTVNSGAGETYQDYSKYNQ